MVPFECFKMCKCVGQFVVTLEGRSIIDEMGGVTLKTQNKQFKVEL
jgi:hypothetical protein